MKGFVVSDKNWCVCACVYVHTHFFFSKLTKTCVKAWGCGKGGKAIISYSDTHDSFRFMSMCVPLLCA